jgi:2-polyprenyl-6-methoxyphenol hydroxylase-like FAD-dependent oxidoreductase
VASAAINALPQPLAELVASSSRHMGVAAISDMVLSGCVIDNKVAFVGKAGAVVRPHCCSAAHKAVLDAASLAEALRGSKLVLEKALPRWEQRQVQHNLALCHEAVAAGERMQGFASC